MAYPHFPLLQFLGFCLISTESFPAALKSDRSIEACVQHATVITALLSANAENREPSLTNNFLRKEPQLVDSVTVVPKKGLEPPHPCEYMDLNHARLPIPPLRHGIRIWLQTLARLAVLLSLANAACRVKSASPSPFDSAETS